MANYAFKGLRLDSTGDIRQALGGISECLSCPLERVSLKLRCRDLSSLVPLIQGTGIADLTAFGWSAAEGAANLPDPLLRLAKRARLSWKNRTLSFEEHFNLPWYDWDGSHSGLVRMTLEERHSAPHSTGEAKPSSETLTRLLVAGGVPPAAARTSSSWEGGSISHLYSVVLPEASLAAAARQIATEFDFKDGRISWELHGTEAELRQALGQWDVRQTDYAAGCFHLNAPHLDHNFAVRAHWLTPVVNCSCDDALEVIGRLLVAKTDCVLEISRTFLSWRLPNGLPGPRTQGNLFQLRYERGKFRLFVGAEQFADSDPPVRRISPRFHALAKQFGAELKPNGLML